MQIIYIYFFITNRNITASNNWYVGVFGIGEGWHNYHHSFPWDYKASELWNINSTTRVIDTFAKIGWAYDLKETSDEMIMKRSRRTGDGSDVQAIFKNGKLITDNQMNYNHHDGELWGYDDKDMTQQQRQLITIKI